MRLPIPDPFSPVEIHQLIDASRDDVFNVLANPETYPDWLVGAQRIRAVDDSFPQPGAKFDHSVGPAEPATVDDRTEVLEAHGHRKLVLAVHAGPFHGEVEFDLRKRGETTTEVVMPRTSDGAGLAPDPAAASGPRAEEPEVNATTGPNGAARRRVAKRSNPPSLNRRPIRAIGAARNSSLFHTRTIPADGIE